METEVEKESTVVDGEFGSSNRLHLDTNGGMGRALCFEILRRETRD